MSAHRIFSSCILLLSTSVLPADADEELDVLGKEAGRLVYSHLMERSRAIYEERDREVQKALASKEAIEQRGARLRKQLRENIGHLPSGKDPLNAKVTGTIDCGAYRVENVVFESRPSHRVTANVFVPATGPGPFPGILIACGHSPTGKIGYQSVGALFARNGFVAIIYDAICQGERVQVPGFAKTAGHSRMLVGSVLVGRTVVGSEAWDGMRALDYLRSRDDVDPSLPIGMTGNSGGGNRTNFLMALDDRIGPAAPSCFVMRLHRKFETLGPGDGCQCLPNGVACAIDHADMAWIRAPHPTLILAAERDYVEFNSTWEVAGELEELYSALDIPERTDLFSYKDKHGFSTPRQTAAVAWMKRWLKDDRSPVIPNEDQQRLGKELQATTSGQVLKEFKDERSVMQLDLERAKALAEQRKQFWAQESEQTLAALRTLIGSRQDPGGKTATENHGTIPRDGYRIDKLILQGPDQLPIPALLFTPDKLKEDGVAYLHASDKGKASADSMVAIEQLVQGGSPVLSIDLRGYGETTDTMCRRKGFGRQYGIATLSLQLGTPLLGQRVDELVVAGDALLSQPGVDHLHLIGSGAAAPVALHAAALDDRFAALTLHNSIRSWTEAIDEEPDYSYLVFRALEHYDLPDLAKVVAPRKITWTVDGQRQ